MFKNVLSELSISETREVLDPAAWIGAGLSVGGYSGKTNKAERTRAQILTTAMELLRDRGYEGTTMRAIAEAAGLSLGSTYYYFRSKEQLIQAFYTKTHVEHLAACTAILDTETSLEKRLQGVMQAKLETIEPYHRFSGVLFKTAGDPASPLNPFSELSDPLRRQATALFRAVLEGSDLRLKGKFAEELPNLLWVFHMGIILYWIHDRSNGQERSYRLAQRTVDIVVRLIRIANLAPLRPLVRATLRLIEELRDLEPPTGSHLEPVP